MQYIQKHNMMWLKIRIDRFNTVNTCFKKDHSNLYVFKVKQVELKCLVHGGVGVSGQHVRLLVDQDNNTNVEHAV